MKKRVVIIEDSVYLVSESQYSKLKKFEETNTDNDGFDLRMSDYLEINKKDYKSVGEIDYMFRI